MHTLGVVDPAEFLPDNPAQRLPWVLALALLLVMLALIGFGRLLRLPARQPVTPKPLLARIYELPASRGAAAARHEAGAKALHAAPVPRSKPAPKAMPAPPPVQHALAHQSRPITHTPAAPALPKPVPKPTPAPPPAHHGVHHLPRPSVHKPASPEMSKPVPRPTPALRHVQHAVRHPSRPIERRPAASPRAKPATAAPRPRDSIDWSALQSQIDAAVNEDTYSKPALPQYHDPHTLVARYYLASLLSKLQRIGNMNYPTDLIGVPVVDLLVASDGSLVSLKLLRSSGNPALDRDALAIVRESAPFAPFPEDMLRQTRHIRLVCYMQFNGYRHINPIF